MKHAQLYNHNMHAHMDMDMDMNTEMGYGGTGMGYGETGTGECVYPLNQRNSDNSKFSDVLKHFIKFREMHCLTNTQLNQRIRETLTHTQIYRQIEFTIVAKSNITDSNYRCY